MRTGSIVKQIYFVKNLHDEHLRLFKELHVNIFNEIISKGLRALRPFFGPHLRSKYESGHKRISLHDFIRPIFLVFHFGFSLDLAVH